MNQTTLTLAVDSSQVGTAAAAFDRMVGAGNAAAAAGGKVTASANAQGKAISQVLVPASARGKVAFADLAAAAEKLSPNAFKQVTAAMALTAAQAAQTAAAVSGATRAINTPLQIRTTSAAPSVRTPLPSPSPLSSAIGARAPTAGNIAQLTGDAGRAQTAVDRLTAAARNQRSALVQLAPAAAATAVSYRQLASTPITLAAPQGLSNAAAALANAAAQANNARVAIGNLNAVRAPAPASQASGALGAAGARVATQQNNALAVSARQAAFQQQQLAFQLNDFFVQVASGGSPLTALIQQGSQLSGTFGGIGNAVRSVTGLLTPARLAFGGVATAVGVLALAFQNGQRQNAAFSNAILLSGNYAGQTEGKFNALTREIASHGDATRTAAREAAQALLATGEIGPQVFAAATEAAALYSLATGKTAEDVAKDFATMSRAPAKFAAEANRSLNFITAAQYASIKSFEDNGRAADAQGVIYDALKARLAGLSNNLPYLDKRLHELKDAWSKMWDAASGIGRKDTIEQQLSSVEQRMKMFQTEQAKFGNLEPGLAKGKKPITASAKLEAERLDLLKRQFREGENAFAEANRAEINKAAIAADAIIEGYTKRAKAAEGYKQKLAELERGFKAKEDAGVPLSDADKNIAIGQLKKDFAGPKAAGGSEASQILRAQLDQDLNGFQQALERERDAFAFHNRFLQGEYQAGGISLRAFYEDKRQTAAAAVAAELAELEQERARLEQFKRATKDPSERLQTQTKLDDNAALQEKVRVSAGREIELSNQEETASFKALNDQVTNYRANLLQMQGDEAGAARLRAQSAITAAQVLSRQAAGIPGAEVDVNALGRAIAITDQFNEVQRQSFLLVHNSARAEEAYGLAAELTGKSLIETERGIYKVRVEELAQLGALAAKARELADASTDPRIKAFASDLALEYAKAAAAIDPALNRLRDANRELASGLANTAGQAPNAFAREYTSRRLAAADDIKDQRDEYSRKIDLLEGYLATTQDKNDKARLRARIKDAEGKRDSVKGESRGSSVLKAINDAVIQPMAEQVFQTVNKLLITDPLQKYLEGQLKGLTEGDGMLAGVFKDALGIQADPKDAALAMQTAAIDSSRDALNALTQAAQVAASALSSPIPTGADPLAPGAPAPAVLDAQSEATDTLLGFSKTATGAASDVARLASAAGVGGNAMGRLPGIVGLFQSAIAAMSTSNAASSSGSGIFGAIAGMFADSGGYEGAVASTGIYHAGGIVGSSPASRTVGQSVFAGAAKYHTGGIAGKAPDLKPNEVAAILMGGPKGVREEVITADDPRHRDNLGMNALAKIMAESRHEGMRVRGARELGGPVSANSMYRVNEKRPELLQVAGKQYLMTGSQGGTVQANEGGGKGGNTINLTVNVTPPVGASTASAQQFGATAGRQMQNALRRNT